MHLLLESRFVRVQALLRARCDDATLDQPLSGWVVAADRHLPQAFVALPIREIIASSYRQLTQTRNLGLGRIEKLIDVLERAADPAPPINLPPLNRANLEATSASSADLVLPAELTETIWREWCHAIHDHRLGGENLGQFVATLGDLPQGLWLAPLCEFADRTLTEIRNIPGYGPSRVEQILETFSRIAQSISSPQVYAPLALRLSSSFARDAALWAEAVLEGESIPDAPAIREAFLIPLFSQLETDLGAETAAIVRRRLGADAPAETLVQIAMDYGLTRERIRQIALRAGEAIHARWPEGRHVLENVFRRLQASPGNDQQLAMLHALLDCCFDLRIAREGAYADVLGAWDRAGRAKQTPMTEAEVRIWASEEFPDRPANLILRSLETEGYRHHCDGGALFFSPDPLDQFLLRLHENPGPVLVAELAKLIGGEERTIRMRMERDPRFVEDDFKRVWAAEHCSFFRRAGRWSLRLDPLADSGLERRAEAIEAAELAHLVVGGLMHAGICDATVWGVHRFAASSLRQVYAAALSAHITPFVLAVTLIRHSDGLVRHMRRRRLRWDSADGSIPIRGKRGWIDHVATGAGMPMTFEEFDTALKGVYQDYEPYSLKQLHADEEEDGETGHGYQFVPGVSHVVPAVLIPGGWELDADGANVSPGVRRAVAKIVSMAARSPFPKSHLDGLPWMVRLCELAAPGPISWAETP